METKTIKKARLLYRRPLTGRVKENLIKVIEDQPVKRSPGIITIGGEDCGPIIIVDFGPAPQQPVGDPRVMQTVKNAIKTGSIKRTSAGGITTLTISQKGIAPIRVIVIEKTPRRGDF
ncbi:MAG: hypothetical protein PETM_01996 [Petrimonas sp.]|mgnify:FL=1|jgi:hypothetical protein|uniref:hypothetical protein n=1 Tax=Petrimonas sp. TaxID=2023866 RepID=UPI000E8D6463|nr:hypothetical protein [Porphyromonadaceae bacterium]